MTLKSLLKVCYSYDSNVKSIRITSRSAQVQKIISGQDSEILVSAITLPIQRVAENDELCQFEVIQFGIEDNNTLFVNLN